MDCKTLHFSRHAFERMFQRGINPDAVAQIIIEVEATLGANAGAVGRTL